MHCVSCSHKFAQSYSSDRPGPLLELYVTVYFYTPKTNQNHLKVQHGSLLVVRFMQIEAIVSKVSARYGLSNDSF